MVPFNFSLNGFFELILEFSFNLNSISILNWFQRVSNVLVSYV